jgi:hypothetical protein
LNVGVVDEFSIASAPVVFGDATPPFKGIIDRNRVALGIRMFPGEEVSSRTGNDDESPVEMSYIGG